MQDLCIKNKLSNERLYSNVFIILYINGHEYICINIYIYIALYTVYRLVEQKKKMTNQQNVVNIKKRKSTVNII